MKLNGTTIYPTGKCFDDALDYISERVKANPSELNRTRLLLVHAICVIPEGSPNAGERFAHAWVEEVLSETERTAWQGGLLEDGLKVYFGAPVEQVYEFLKPSTVRVYTIAQAVQENIRTEHYGPWEPVFQALTKDGKVR